MLCSPQLFGLDLFACDRFGCGSAGMSRDWCPPITFDKVIYHRGKHHDEGPAVEGQGLVRAELQENPENSYIGIRQLNPPGGAVYS